jgi:replicative DNA helicase
MWFSLQESGGHAALRLLCHAARMPLARVTAGDVVTRHDLETLSKLVQVLAQYPVQIHDTSPLSVVELKVLCEDWAGQGRSRLILIDPIEALTDEEGCRWGSHPKTNENIAGTLGLLAMDLGTPIVCFATIPSEPDDSRAVPTLAALPESFAPLIAKADVVTCLKTRPFLPGDRITASALHVLKQSNGRDEMIQLMFRPDLMLFEDVG